VRIKNRYENKNPLEAQRNSGESFNQKQTNISNVYFSMEQTFFLEKGCPRLSSPLPVMVPAINSENSVVQLLKDMFVAR